VEVGWGPAWVAVGQSEGLVAWKSPAATLPPELEEPPEEGAAEVALDGAADEEDAFFVVEEASVEEVGALHDLRRFNLGAAGTRCGSRALSWWCREARWAP